MSSAHIISVLARRFVAGELTFAATHARAVRMLGRHWSWLRPLVLRFLGRFEAGVRPRHRDVVGFLQTEAAFQRAIKQYGSQIKVVEWLGEPLRMHAAPVVLTWKLPVIATTGDLADWLSLYPNELDWFANLKRPRDNVRNPKLQHYHYCVIVKRSGGQRLIETPKANLMALQRRILSGILDRIPIHPAAQGFVKGRSILSFAAPHVRQAVLLRLDLENFFPAFPAARIQALFRTLGYPEPVADALGGLCSNRVPRGCWSGLGEDAQVLYGRPHLPQGAPTSPTLSNLMAYRLDCRLSGLAASAGATYTRYADDLAFSGSAAFCRRVERFSRHAAAIALEEGFGVNHRKTRIMRSGSRQQLAGLVVNREVTLPRRERDLLEAILTNCIRQGPASQNREGVPDFRAHLQGRVSYLEMVDRAKGQRLRRLFAAINWKQ